jgi:hypothetical protein
VWVPWSAIFSLDRVESGGDGEGIGIWGGDKGANVRGFTRGTPKLRGFLLIERFSSSSSVGSGSSSVSKNWLFSEFDEPVFSPRGFPSHYTLILIFFSAGGLVPVSSLMDCSSDFFELDSPLIVVVTGAANGPC